MSKLFCLLLFFFFTVQCAQTPNEKARSDPQAESPTLPRTQVSSENLENRIEAPLEAIQVEPVPQSGAPAGRSSIWISLTKSWLHLFATFLVGLILWLAWRLERGHWRHANTAVLLFLTLLVSCRTSPTGRSQIALLPEEQLRAMGAAAFADVKKKMPINNNPEVNAYVRCIAREITLEVPKKQDWEIVVFENDTPNAFALPGGKIGVHTGMLKIARVPAELAAVIGHEVAHVTGGQANERVSEELLMQGGFALASIILSEKESTRYRLTMAALGLGAQYGIVLPHSRRQEREADILGLRYMARGGFDPRLSVQLWHNMQKSEPRQTPEFLSTHPSYGTRIENLYENMTEALAVYDKLNRRSQCLSRRLVGKVGPK